MIVTIIMYGKRETKGSSVLYHQDMNRDVPIWKTRGNTEKK